jgi:hypothetical protein
MNENRKPNCKIFVDADACPVKVETIQIASRNNVEVYIVSNGGIRPSSHPLVKTIVVDSGPDEADNWIVANISKHDVVITSDIPLSGRCIEKNAYVISPSGEHLTPENIGVKTASRNLMFEIRAADPFHKGKGKAFSKFDRIKYINALEKLIQTVKKS